VIERQRDPQVATAHAIEASKLRGGIVAVIRQGFSDPLYYVQDGELRGALDTIRALTIPVVEAEQHDPAPKSKPRARKKPSETKTRKHVKKEHKSSPAYIVECKASEDGKLGTVDAVVNLYGILDDGQDIIFPGYFAKSLSENGQRVRVLNSHNMKDGVLEAVGKPLMMREIGRNDLPPEVLSRFPEAMGGLWTSTQFMLTDERSKAVYDRLDAGWINEWSVGFDDLQSERSRIKRVFNGAHFQYEKALPTDSPDDLVKDSAGRPVVARLMRQGRLWEYSPVLWGQNPGTFVESIKDGHPVEAKPYAVFEQDGEFCVYKIDESGERVGDSLGCHDSETDANDQVAALYASEQDSKEYTPQGAIRRLGDVLLANMIQGGTSVLTLELGAGTISAEEFSLLSALHNQHLNEFRAMMPDDVALREMPEPLFWFAADGADDTKAGRVLNERNYQKIKQAGELLSDVLSSAGLTDETEEHAADGPSVSIDAPTPSDGAGPQDDETPATKKAELLRVLDERLAEMEA